MPGKFITNQGRLLTEVANNILPTSQSLYFLIGYFYFSGFEQIYKNLTDKKIRILIGMEIERALSGAVKEVEIVSDKERYSSNKEIRDSYFSDLADVFNHSDFFDSTERENAFRLFVQKLMDGSMEIRKTKDPNHAKLYLFEKTENANEGGEYPGVVITGSSNLSLAGLRNRQEINVIFRDKSDYEEAKEIFDLLWESSLELVGPTTLELFNRQVIEKIWLDNIPSPYFMYLRVLEEYFSFEEQAGIKTPSTITGGTYANLKYQIDAIHQSLHFINIHNGVIIADVVGLGKSIIASAVAHNLGLKTVVIAPPHLCEQWDEYRTEFGFNARVFSSGKIEDAVEAYCGKNEELLVIIDEAHKYRNEETRDYAYLHRLCQGNKVALLSGTPFRDRKSVV